MNSTNTETKWMTIDPRDWLLHDATADPSKPPFPFIEDENGNITGLGHQDIDRFAIEVKRFDTDVAGNDPDDLDLEEIADSVEHTWVRIDPADEERLHPCKRGDDGAFPVTTLWGFR